MFYPTSETATDPNTATAMLFDSAEPQLAGGPLASLLASATTSGPASNTSITDTQNMPATSNDLHHQHHHHNHNHQSVQTLPCFNDLIAVLIECFALIAIGYLSGRFKLISSDAKDIGAYLTTFALPMIIFLNVAQMEISTINLSFLACMLASKLILFIMVTVITLAISYPANFSYAGALSILATQSNDFALGYPLFKSLYGESKPEMLGYLNLMGPIQLLIINPLGIVMLEFEKSRTNRTLRRRANSILARKKCQHCLDNSANNHTPPPPPPAAQEIPLASSIDYHTVNQSQLVRRLNSPIRRLSYDSNPSGGLKGRNVKSLTLVMPARNLHKRSLSDDSTDESSIDCYLRQQTNNSQTTPPILHGVADMNSSTDLSELEIAFKKEKSSRPTSNEQPEPGQKSPGPAPQQGATLGKCTCWNDGASGEDGRPLKEPLIDLGFVKALLTNPLIIASVVALAVNLINGPELPKFVTKVSNTIAASFAAPALFVVGLSMYGKFKLILRNPNDLLLSSVLVLTKVFILPNLMRTIMLIVLPHYAEPEEIPYLADFSYLYGLLPTAPGACIIAKQYEVLTNVVSICMLLSTFISAPMMLGTSAIISQVSATPPETILNIVAQTLRVSSSITLTLSLLTLYMLWKSNRRVMSSLDRLMRNVAELKATHVFTFLLALTQLLIGIAGFLWLFVDTSKLKQQSFLDLMTRDTSALSASSDGDPHWPRDDMDDLLAEEERIHPIGLDPAPETAHAFMIAPSPQAVGFGALCTMKYVLASGGLLMARFIILCIVVTNFAKHFRGHQLAVQVSSLLLKVYPLFGIGVILCLVLESHHLSCLPSESSLPRWSVSLYLRLTFNTILLLMAVPLFTATFRFTNKAAWLESRAMQPAGDASPRLLEKRRFVTSNASLSSDTSSAITTSTNLETTTLNAAAAGATQSQQQQSSQRGHTGLQQVNLMSHQDQQQQVDPTMLLVDYDITSQLQQQGTNLQTSPAPVQGYHQHHQQQTRSSKVRDCHQDGGSSRGANQLLALANEDERQQSKKQQRKQTTTQCDKNNNCNELYKSTKGLRSVGCHDGNQTTKIHIAHNDAIGTNLSQNIPEQTGTTMIAAHAVTTETTTGNHHNHHHNHHHHHHHHHSHHHAPDDHWPPSTEFNKYSILVVFMLFQALVSLTSIIQLLNQEKPAGGTFVMGEITNVAIDFGQGLVTFLVIGSQSYFKGLISSFGSSSSSSARMRQHPSGANSQQHHQA